MAKRKCTHCGSFIKKRAKGYECFALHCVLFSGITGREALEAECGLPIPKLETTPSGNRHFLCKSCWAVLGRVARYRQAVKEFWDKGSSSSLYIEIKKKHDKSYDRNSETGIKSNDTHDKHNDLLIESRKRKHDPVNDHDYYYVEKSNDELSETEKEHVEKRPRLDASELTVKVPFKYAAVFRGLKECRYHKVIRYLWNISRGFRHHFQEEVTRMIRREVSSLFKTGDKFPLCQEVNLSNILEFSWETTLSMVKEQTPLLFAALQGIATKKGDSLVSKAGRKLDPVVGTALSCLLKGREPHKAKFIPTVNSVQFWKGGLKQETIIEMSRTGICLCAGPTRKAVKKLGDDLNNVDHSTLDSLIEDEVEHADLGTVETLGDEVDNDFGINESSEDEVDREHDKGNGTDPSESLCMSVDEVDHGVDGVDESSSDSDLSDQYDYEEDNENDIISIQLEQNMDSPDDTNYLSNEQV